MVPLTQRSRRRLASMQAQVEPQFLFDSLVDIEKLYRRDASRAADDLDRLISYLRVALPRLRESGSTIEAEIELVQAYLAVVTSLHGGRPALSITLPEELEILDLRLKKLFIADFFSNLKSAIANR